MISAEPSVSLSDVGPLVSETRSVVKLTRPRPSELTVMFGASPACGPSGALRPCFRFPGLKCAPADENAGEAAPSHRPTAWKWIAIARCYALRSARMSSHKPGEPARP